jgi:hypothetical protein
MLRDEAAYTAATVDQFGGFAVGEMVVLKPTHSKRADGSVDVYYRFDATPRVVRKLHEVGFTNWEIVEQLSPPGFRRLSYDSVCQILADSEDPPPDLSDMGTTLIELG